MSSCKKCVKRSVYQCDVHGTIPVEYIEKANQCKDFAPFEEPERVLERWLAASDAGSIERIYIESLLASFDMRINQSFDSAVLWLYNIPSTPGARSVRDAVQIFDNWTPI